MSLSSFVRVPYKRPADTLRSCGGQSLAVLVVAVDQREDCQQALAVLLQAAIAHLYESESALGHAKRPLDLAAAFGLGPVPALLFLVHARLDIHAMRGHVLNCRRSRMDGFCLASIAGIAPHPVLGPCNRVGQHVHAGERRRHGPDRMHDGVPGVHADVRHTHVSPAKRVTYLRAPRGRIPLRFVSVLGRNEL